MIVSFADTSYYVALFNRRDQNHSRAVSYSRSSQDRIVTTSWVIVETADTFSKLPLRPFFGLLMGILTTDVNSNILPVQQIDLDAGINLYLGRPDKEWSLTDCISFEIMRKEGLTHALTGDHHFRQAGFTNEFP